MVKRIPGSEHDRDLSFPYPGTSEHKGGKDGGSEREGSCGSCCGLTGRGAAVWSQHHRSHLSALTAVTQGQRLRTAPGFHIQRQNTNQQHNTASNRLKNPHLQRWESGMM